MWIILQCTLESRCLFGTLTSVPLDIYSKVGFLWELSVLFSIMTIYISSNKLQEFLFLCIFAVVLFWIESLKEGKDETEGERRGLPSTSSLPRCLQQSSGPGWSRETSHQSSSPTCVAGAQYWKHHPPLRVFSRKPEQKQKSQNLDLGTLLEDAGVSGSILTLPHFTASW